MYKKFDATKEVPLASDFQSRYDVTQMPNCTPQPVRLSKSFKLRSVYFSTGRVPLAAAL